MKPKIVFVYNADDGLFNSLTDMAHKLFSPSTYACQLCAITHHHLGMRQAWKQVLQSLEYDCVFLHRNQLHAEYGMQHIALPAVFIEDKQDLQLLIDSAAINQCEDIEALTKLLHARLSQSEE